MTPEYKICQNLLIALNIEKELSFEEVNDSFLKDQHFRIETIKSVYLILPFNSEIIKKSESIDSFMNKQMTVKKNYKLVFKFPTSKRIFKMLLNKGIECLAAQKFIIDIRRHILSLKHKILDKTDKTFKYLYIDPAKIPTISKNDPQIAYLQADVGQIIAINRQYPTPSWYYRLVI